MANLTNCPVCNRVLINGRDSKQQIRYPDDWRQKFEREEITLEELNQHAEIYYTRERLCNTSSLPEFENKPCPNYHGGDISNPKKVVELIDIIDN